MGQAMRFDERIDTRPGKLTVQPLAIADFAGAISVKDETCAPIFFDLQTRRHTQPRRQQSVESFAQTFAGAKNKFISVGAFDYAVLPRRQKSEVRKSRAWVFDLDHGSFDEAIKSLKGFIAASRLVPNVIVNSGHGAHAYYVVRDPVGPDAWAQIAERLLAAAAAHGLAVDAQCTKDPARVMRLPDTINAKPDKGLADVLTQAWRVHRE